MRILEIKWLVVLALALASTGAKASSVEVIWQNSGTGTTTVAPGATGIVGDIILSVGVGDSPVTAVGLSADSTGTVLMIGSTQILPAGWFDLAHESATTNPHSDAVISMGDLFLLGAVFTAGMSVSLGTITVNAGAGGGSAVVAATGGGDTIYDDQKIPVTDEFSFGGGIVNVPEPNAAGLLGLGLLGLSLVQRSRRHSQRGRVPLRLGMRPFVGAAQASLPSLRHAV